MGAEDKLLEDLPVKTRMMRSTHCRKMTPVYPLFKQDGNSHVCFGYCVRYFTFNI